MNRPSQPLLRALGVFECAGRHQSFTKAAHELNVTQAAVSKSIRLLEKQLGVALFTRIGPKLSLTSDGLALLRNTSTALNHIEEEFNRLRPSKPSPVITISAPENFIHYWLRPRIRLHADMVNTPSIRIVSHMDINLVAPPKECDIFVSLSEKEIEGWVQNKLFHVEFFPIATKAFINHHRLGSNLPLLPNDIANLPIAEFEKNTMFSINFEAWLNWANQGSIGLKDYILFPNYSMTVEEMLNHKAACLASAPMFPELFSANEIIELSNIKLKTTSAYYLCYPDTKVLNAEALQLYNWLLSCVSPEDHNQ